MARARILIVDDDPAVLEALRIAFLGKPWHVESATVAAAALSRHEAAAYDLLIVDKHLPDQDGVELIRQLRAGGDPVHIVMLTGYGSAESAVDALNLGIDAYLLKPFSSADVTETIEGVLTRSPAPPPPGPPPPPNVDLDVQWAEPPASAPAAPAGGRRMGDGFRALVAGADPRARQQLAALIALGPEAVRFAGDVPELLALIDREIPDLVLLQGALDSAEVIARIRSHSPDIPCVVLTEGARLATVTRLIELRIIALIGDPLDSPNTKRRLGEIVRRLSSDKRRGAASELLG